MNMSIIHGVSQVTVCIEPDFFPDFHSDFVKLTVKYKEYLTVVNLIHLNIRINDLNHVISNLLKFVV